MNNRINDNIISSPFNSWRRRKIVDRPVTYKETITGITNPSRVKTAYHVFYSTLCGELKTKTKPQQRIIMGDAVLRPLQRRFRADDLAAEAAANNFDDDVLDAADYAEAEDVDSDDDVHFYDYYFGIRVKRRIVRTNKQTFLFLFFSLVIFFDD